MAAYRYPVIATRADVSADEVYAFTKAMDESYADYKGGTAVMERWSLDTAGKQPADLPFHEGAIRYLEEKGVWTAEDNAWNATRLKRLEALRAAWGPFVEANKDRAAEDFAAAWMARRDEVVVGLAQ